MIRFLPVLNQDHCLPTFCDPFDWRASLCPFLWFLRCLWKSHGACVPEIPAVPVVREARLPYEGRAVGSRLGIASGGTHAHSGEVESRAAEGYSTYANEVHARPGHAR